MAVSETFPEGKVGGACHKYIFSSPFSVFQFSAVVSAPIELAPQ